MGVWSDGLGERNRISSNLPGEGGGNSSCLPAQTVPSPLIALPLQGEHRSCCTGRGSFHKCGDALTVMSLVADQTSTSLPVKHESISAHSVEDDAFAPNPWHYA